MDSQTGIRFDASVARLMAETAQSKNFEQALKHIEERAEMGFTEAILFTENLDSQGIKKLTDMGFSVTTITDPLKYQYIKVRW